MCLHDWNFTCVQTSTTFTASELALAPVTAVRVTYFVPLALPRRVQYKSGLCGASQWHTNQYAQHQKALAAGLEVGRLNLRAAYPMLLFVR